MTASVKNWRWEKRPGACFKNGFLVEGNQEPVWYSPGEYQSLIFNDLIKISDEKTAIQFAKLWGFLNISNDVMLRSSLSDQYSGAYHYLYHLNGNNYPTKEEAKQIEKFFNYPLPPGDTLSEILHFAQRINYLSQIKRILDGYHNRPTDDYDVTSASYDAEQWVKNSKDAAKYLHSVNLFDVLTEQCKGFGISDVNKYLLEAIISSERVSFSHRSKRVIWVELQEVPFYNPEYSEVNLSLMFSSLARFIEYSLLTNKRISPKLCADPNCKQMFFPEKSDQRYCPPPPGVKRSRCEGRHSQELKREKVKANERLS